MERVLSEHDLEQLSEPTRGAAFEFLWLLRESGHSEELALRLALRGAYELDATTATSETAPPPIVDLRR